MDIKLIKGRVLAFHACPFDTAADETAVLHEAVLIRNGHISDVGPAAQLQARAPDAAVEDMGDALILPGFIDAHVHYPQTAIIASWGKRLVDWLNSYTFPEEIRLSDADYAARIAGRYLDLALDHGTTSMASYCTSHPASVSAFFQAAQARGMRVSAGKTCMDRNAPADLLDTAQSAYDDSKALIETWHGRSRLNYVLTPRFAPTSSPEQLEALGALWREHPDLVLQTHLSEQVEEIAWVRQLFPAARDYLDVYEGFGLLGPRGVYGHAIHLTPREWDRLAEVGTALAHCPTSNTFIGSGLFDMAQAKARGLRVGLATDTGGGSSFSMLRSMAAAYEISQLNGRPLHPAQLLYLATTGAAEALCQSDRIGAIQPGLEADLIALDLQSTPAIAQRAARAEDLWEALFPTIMMGDDRAIRGVWVAGQRRQMRGTAA